MDKINLLHGRDIVKIAGMDLKRKWKMNRNRLTPNYTSKINEIITINANE